MEVTFRPERPAGEVAVRVRTVVALTELAIEEEVSLAGFSLLRRAWNKNWGDL